MAISLESLSRSTSLKPPRIIVHGVQGVGKSTFASQADNPVFIVTEDGLGKINVAHTPLLRTFDEVLDWLGALYEQKHDHSTLVIDSLDWLEPLIWQHVCKVHNVQSIEDFSYGKGFLLALDVWRQYIEGINALRDDRDMAIVQIAHTQVKRFDSPETDPYDRYEIKLHAKAAALLQEHADAVLFMNYKVHTSQKDVGFKKKHVRGIGDGTRVLYTEERPAFAAKNRYGLPAEIPLPKRDGMWQAFEAAMAGEIAEPAAEPSVATATTTASRKRAA